jgi:hypothetical protein
MLKFGSILLTLGGIFNFLLAGSILVTITVFQKSAPILYILFDEKEIPQLDAKVQATVKALAILFNASAAGLSLLAIFVVWGALIHRQRWAFWGLLLSAGLTQAMGFVADAALGAKTMIPNLTLVILFVVGLSLAGCRVFGSQTG